MILYSHYFSARSFLDCFFVLCVILGLDLYLVLLVFGETLVRMKKLAAKIVVRMTI